MGGKDIIAANDARDIPLRRLTFAEMVKADGQDGDAGRGVAVNRSTGIVIARMAVRSRSLCVSARH